MGRRIIWDDAFQGLRKHTENTQYSLSQYGIMVDEHCSALFFCVLGTPRDSDLGWGLAASVFLKRPSESVRHLAALPVPSPQKDVTACRAALWPFLQSTSMGVCFSVFPHRFSQSALGKDTNKGGLGWWLKARKGLQAITPLRPAASIVPNL